MAREVGGPVYPVIRQQPDPMAYLRRHYPAAPREDAANGYEQWLFAQMLAARRPRFTHPPRRLGHRLVLILSAPRSGSTLLRNALSFAPEVRAIPEYGLLAYESNDQLGLLGGLGMPVEDPGRLYGGSVLEKSTSYALWPSLLERLAGHFERLELVHLVRDIRAVRRSFARARLDRVFFGGRHPFAPEVLGELVWQTVEQNLSEFEPVRFEELVARPEQSLRELCRRLGLTFQEQMLAPWDVPRAGLDDPFHGEHRHWKVAAPVVEASRRLPCLHQLVRGQDEAPAVAVGPRSYTYAHLRQRVEEVAGFLSGRCRPGSRVGLTMAPGFEGLACMLAIMRVGAIYVPLPPQLPPARRAQVERHIELLVDQPPPAGPDPGLPWDDPTSPAYVLFTSGSTGVPKGVVVAHQGVSNVVLQQIALFEVEPHSRVLQGAPWTFDTSIVQMFMALGAGATLVFPEHPLELAEAARGVTHLDLVPSLLATLPDELEARVISTGGEPCPRGLVQRLATGRRFFHCYGLTETSICSTLRECFADEADDPPIGRALEGVHVYLLEDGQPVPFGAEGELYIGGVGVGLGYLDGGDRFLPDPFRPGKMFRTGDRARYNADGELVFLGRVDRQLKLGGVRLEPGEVESLLRTHPRIEQATAKCFEGSLVVSYQGTLEPALATEYLRQHLPSEAMPTRLERLECETAAATPRGLAARVAGLWAGTVGASHWPTARRFWERGGTSLDLMRFRARLEQELGGSVAMADLFAHPTPAQLAAHLEKR